MGIVYTLQPGVPVIGYNLTGVTQSSNPGWAAEELTLQKPWCESCGMILSR